MQQLYLFLFIIFFFPSCAYEKRCSVTIRKNRNVSIFIPMPENVLVFDNISSIVYKSLQSYFARLGYQLANNETNAYSLSIKIKSLEPMEKLISPDVLLYHQKLKLELFCQLYDSSKKLITQKIFFFFRLISKPTDPIQNTAFLEFEYKRLMHKAAPKIEKFFRSYLNEAETK